MNALMQPFGHIAELCIALAHRWEPVRVFVVLATYPDESGTHGDSTFTVMGGVMANAAQWVRFEAEFAALKKKHDSRMDQSRQFFQMIDLGEMAESAFFAAVTFTLDSAGYDADYKSGDKPRRLRLDSKHGLCFRNCLVFFITEMVNRLDQMGQIGSQPPKLHFVLENGHRNWSEVRDIFNRTKREIKDRSGYDILGDITFADKNDCDPLVMADFLAHASYLQARGEMPLVKHQVPSGQAGMHKLRFAPGGLADRKESLIRKLKAKGNPNDQA